VPFTFSHRQSLALVFCCTIFGVAAQYFIKSSANALHGAGLEAILLTPGVWAGLAMLGMSTAFLVLALRDGELSLLYPVISLTYVWVTVLSVTVFHERMNTAKLAGITVICVGVALLGKGRKA
jgi:multidrug transporter EmrE-like cation transporter